MWTRGGSSIILKICCQELVSRYDKCSKKEGRGNNNEKYLDTCVYTYTKVTDKKLFLKCVCIVAMSKRILLSGRPSCNMMKKFNKEIKESWNIYHWKIRIAKQKEHDEVCWTIAYLGGIEFRRYAEQFSWNNIRGAVLVALGRNACGIQACVTKQLSIIAHRPNNFISLLFKRPIVASC